MSRCSATDPYIFNRGQITRGITHTWQETTPRFVSPPVCPVGRHTPSSTADDSWGPADATAVAKAILHKLPPLAGPSAPQKIVILRWKKIQFDKWAAVAAQTRPLMHHSNKISEEPNTDSLHIKTHRQEGFICFLAGGGGDDSISWEPPELHHKSATGPEVLSLTPPMSSWVVGESDGE